MIGSAHQVTGRSGSSRRLDGLPEEAALALVAGDLGRPLAAETVTETILLLQSDFLRRALGVPDPTS